MRDFASHLQPHLRLLISVVAVEIKTVSALAVAEAFVVVVAGGDGAIEVREREPFVD